MADVPPPNVCDKYSFFHFFVSSFSKLDCQNFEMNFNEFVFLSLTFQYIIISIEIIDELMTL